MQCYVVDSSVFNKLFLDEADREQAQQLFIQAAKQKVQLIAPDLLYLEVINTAQRCGIPVDEVAELLNAQKYLMEMRPVTDVERQKALELIKAGHPNSGYPSIYDALFHAMAICNNALFVTTDHRHYAKTKQLGHIILLREF